MAILISTTFLHSINWQTIAQIHKNKIAVMIEISMDAINLALQ